MRSGKYRSISLISLCLCLIMIPKVTVSAAAVSHGGAAAVLGKVDDLGYSVELYDGTNGLPTSDANTILSTGDGFIWIGGYSGVIRYDGTSFERTLDNKEITNANTMFEDSKGRLWIGTNDNGVVAVKESQSWHFDYKDGLTSSSIRAISEDDKGNIIIGTTQGLYYVDPGMKLNMINEPMLNGEYIEQLSNISGGTIYGLTHTGMIFEIKNCKVDRTLTGDDTETGSYKSIFPDPKNENMLYLGTTSGEVIHGSIDDRFENAKRIKITDPVTDAGLDKEEASRPINWIDYAEGRIWILRDNCIGWLDDANAFHAIHNLPMDSSIAAMETDYEGNLWFASTRQGVMKLVANKFADITEQTALEREVVNATCLHDDKLYIGTDTGLQIISKEHTKISEPIQEMIGDSRVRCLKEDGEGNLWIATYTNKGLVCYTADNKIKSFTKVKGMPDNQIRSITLGSGGDILAATNGGLAIINDFKVVKTIGSKEGLKNTVTLTAIEYDGKHFLGSDGDGLFVEENGSVTHLSRGDGLTSDVILRLKEDKKRGVMWIITSNSIQYMKDGKIKKVEGFPYSNNYDIYFDSGENAWILASNGIYVVKAKDMIERDSYDTLHYDFSSGMPFMATVNAFSDQSENGMLYIAGRAGVFTVNIDEYFELENDIKINIPYVELDGNRYYADENGNIDLPESRDAITIYASAVTYSMQNPRIRYKLDGVDTSYNSVFKQDMGPIRYTNVAGGEHVFTLSVMNTSTGEEQQSYKIVINKALLTEEKTWFKVMGYVLVAALIAGIVAIIMVRRARIYKKNQEKNKQLIREMVEAFAKTIDMKDNYTKGHSARVAQYTVMLAEEMGYSKKEVEEFYEIAMLHDIGKIGVPAEVLNKPGKLTDEEFDKIKSHSSLGYEALKNISIMPSLAIGAKFHHERPDGKGYPDGLKGDEIPEVARVIAVADTFDAMYSNRPYRKRMNFDKAVSIIKEVSGTQLSSDVVDAFLRLVDKGKFRAPDDEGGGSTEDINNIRKHYDDKETKKDQPDKEQTGTDSEPGKGDIKSEPSDQ
ncbi:MAG: HD domain-containing protein [Eubacterium sp.]|nr:HD domain-containing protein [Eubacterium sp.]